MEFVDDYKSKRQKAERLRRAVEAFGSMKAPNPTVYTPESGAFPGMIQANWLAPIAQMGAAFAQKRMSEKADAAEDEAATARMQALEGILNPSAGAQGMGNAPGQTPGINPASGRPSAGQLMQLQELGLDPSVLKMIMPKETPLATITQAAATPAGRQALVQMGVWTQEQADQAGAAADADAEKAIQRERDQYMFEQSNKRFAPPQASQRAPTELDLFMQDPEKYAELMALKGKARSGGSQNPYEKKVAEEQAKVDVKLLEGESKLAAGVERADKLIKDADKLSETKIRSIQAADTLSEMLPGNPKISNVSEQVKLDEQAANQFHLDAMEQMRGFGQVTEAEQGIIRATQFDRYDTPDVRKQKLRVIKDALQRGLEKVKKAKERMQTGQPVLKAPEGGDDLDAEIDALMGGQ